MATGGINTYVVQPSIIFAFGDGEPFSETRYHFDGLRHRPASRTDTLPRTSASCVLSPPVGHRRDGR